MLGRSACAASASGSNPVSLVYVSDVATWPNGLTSTCSTGQPSPPAPFVVTMLFNVPLNNALQTVDAASADAATTWARYLREWTIWNHVRTVASTAACASFIVALTAR